MSQNSKWEYMKEGDDDGLYDEEGNKRDITTNDYIMPFGKYKDLMLSEVSDVGYLKWILAKNEDKKPNDWWMHKLLNMRIKELS